MMKELLRVVTKKTKGKCCMMNALSSNRAYENYKGYYGYQPKIKQN